MRMRVMAQVFAVASVLGAMPLLAATQTRPAEPTFAELLALAKRDLATEKGAAYDTTMGKQFASNQGEGVNTCLEGASKSSMPENFQAVIVVDKDGKVSKVVLSPETEEGKCIRKLLLQEKFPKPPTAPFHDLMDMTFKP